MTSTIEFGSETNSFTDSSSRFGEWKTPEQKRVLDCDAGIHHSTPTENHTHTHTLFFFFFRFSHLHTLTQGTNTRDNTHRSIMRPQTFYRTEPLSSSPCLDVCVGTARAPWASLLFPPSSMCFFLLLYSLRGQMSWSIWLKLVSRFYGSH